MRQLQRIFESLEKLLVRQEGVSRQQSRMEENISAAQKRVLLQQSRVEEKMDVYFAVNKAFAPQIV
jgi:5'-3' exonuclease